MLKQKERMQKSTFDQYFAKSLKMKQNWTRPKSFDISFYVSLSCYCQKKIFGGETRH